jgi:predicted flap endonuclease-1-like 5' DNA nuclease
MWPICNLGASSFLWLLLPLLLGLLTGWWIWANRPRSEGDAYAAPRDSSIGVGGALAGAGAIAAGAGAALAKGASSVVDAGASAVGAVGDTVGDAASTVVDAGSSAISGTAAVAAGAGAAAVGAASSLLDKVSGNASETTSSVAGVGTGAAAVAAGGAGLALTAIGIPAAVGAADDLEMIKGVGPKLNGVLNGLGITRFDQIAAWSGDDVAKVDTHLESFSGRIDREEWIPQAKLLAAGNMTEFNRLYGTAGAAVGAAAAGAVAMTALGIPAAVGAPDDLLQLKGVGPKLNALLNSLGVTRFDQIAAWTAADVAKVDPELGSFKGRIERESWVEQAGLLASGAIAAFEAKFGKLDSENS